MTWTSYFLVIHERTEDALKAGKKYFLMCASGAYVFHYGILFLHSELGSFDIRYISENIGSLPPPVLLAVPLFLFLDLV